MTNGDERVRIGRFGKPHGVHGALRIVSFSGEIEHFRSLAGTTVTCVRETSRTEVAIVTVAIHHRTPVVTVAGVKTPEDARALVGYEIEVARSAAAPLNTDEYYVADLVGCELTVDGGVVGTIVGVADGAQAPLLEIQRGLAGEKTVFVPFMSVYIGDVDVAGRTVALEEPWILDSI